MTLQALELQVNQYGSAEDLRGYIRGALARGLPELVPALCSHDGTFVIVGSGPSLPQFVEEIREEKKRGRPICAINHAHDFLIEKGIEPTFFLTLDPRPRANHHLRLLCQDTIYLMASRCHPEMFDRLKENKVILWHSFADEDKADEIWKAQPRCFLVGGGSTSGIRAFNVAYMMGFRKFAMYGIDSCLAPDGMTKRFNGDKSGQILTVYPGSFQGTSETINESRAFLTNYAMAQQGRDFCNLYRDLPNVSIVSYGDGLLTALIEERKKAGLPT